MEYINKNINWIKIFIVLFISSYMFYYITSLSEWHFIDNVNLIFHEAGHVIFGFLGNFIGMLGGTLMQILIPILLSFYFFRNNDYFSASLLLFWVSQNLFNIFIYMKDAVKMELPLLGGDSVYHDWNYIFSSLNLLDYTRQISLFVYIIGIIVLIFAIILSYRFSIHKVDTF